MRSPPPPTRNPTHLHPSYKYCLIIQHCILPLSPRPPTPPPALLSLTYAMEGERTAVTYCWLGHQMCHKKAPLSQQRCLFPWQPAAMSRWHAFLWWGRRRQGWWPMESSSRAADSWRRMKKTAAWPLLATSECCRQYPAIVWGDFIAATSRNFSINVTNVLTNVLP